MGMFGKGGVLGAFGLGPTWMKAVAMMTPEPKYFAMKKAADGTLTPRCRAAKTGKHAPGDGVLLV